MPEDPAPLPLKVRRHRPCEPAYGLLGRLAARHNRRDTRHFASMVGLDFGLVLSGRATAAVAALAGFDADEIVSSTAVLVKGGVTFRGHRFVAADWNVMTASRVCTHCLKEDLDAGDAEGPFRQRAYRRVWWDFKGISACPKHRVPLVSQCPSCHEPLNVADAEIWRCRRCDDGLTRTPVQRLSEADVRADAYLLARLLGELHPVVEPLNGMPVRVAATTLLRLGWHISNPRKSLGRNTLPPDGGLSCRAIGYEVLCQWPERYRQALDRLLAQSSGAGGRALTGIPSPLTAYGLLYRWLSVQTEEGIAPLREEMRTHFLRNVAVDKNTMVFGAPADGSSYVTLRYANEFCGAGGGSKTLLQILYNWGFVRAGARAREVKIPRHLLWKLRKAHQNIVSVEKAAEELGTSEPTLHHFLEAGLLQKMDGPYAKSGLLLRYEIMELVRRALRHGNRETLRKPENTLTMHEACRYRPAAGDQGMIRIVQSLLDGTLHAAGRLSGIKGLGGILLDRAAFQQWTQTAA